MKCYSETPTAFLEDGDIIWSEGSSVELVSEVVDVRKFGLRAVQADSGIYLHAARQATFTSPAGRLAGEQRQALPQTEWKRRRREGSNACLEPEASFEGTMPPPTGQA